jgi:hypothetical protein
VSSKTLTLAKIIAGMMNLPKQTGEVRHGFENGVFSMVSHHHREENRSRKTVREMLYLE